MFDLSSTEFAPPPAEKPSPLQAPRTWRDSLVVKLICIAILVLALLIPLAMVQSLVFERQARLREVEAEIARSWGSAQTLAGPVIQVPYSYFAGSANGVETFAWDIAYLLPSELVIEGKVTPGTRSRGPFEVIVYRSDLRIRGKFRRGDLDLSKANEIDWAAARLVVGIPDLRGIRRDLALEWGERRVPFRPGTTGELATAGIHALISDFGAVPNEREVPFAFDLDLAGTGSLRFLPYGERTAVALRSTWPSPGFVGAFLPSTHEVGKKGFHANWATSYFGRGYPQSFMGRELANLSAQIQGSSFGVEFVETADGYQQVERSVKYGLLFILLTFATYFLFEVFHPFSVHPVQYLLVGAALSLFYLLLLSVAEHLAFALAYGLAAGAIVLLLGAYSATVLQGVGRAVSFAAVLSFLYGYLYVLLQAEDYALLLGSVGLLVILALIMFVTRRIDWYAGRPARSASR